MSKRFSGIVCGFLIAMLTTSAISYAAQKTDILNIVYRDIKLKIEEELITPRDASGNVVEPFISDGTTYLPVRAVAEALNRDVSWENETSTVVISGKPLKELRLASEIPFSASRTRFDVYKSGDYTEIRCFPMAQSRDMSGWYDFSEKIVYNLGGKAETTADSITIYGTGLIGGTVNSCNDHRIAMAAAIAAARCKEPVTICGAEAVNKSYPGFFEDYKTLGGKANVIHMG